MNRQELIGKYENKLKDVQLKFGANFKTKVYEELLEDLKQLDEPQKVTVPKSVADWIFKAQLVDRHSLRSALETETIRLYAKNSDEVIAWLKDKSNQDIFATAWINGYTVEKEKRYIVKMSATKQPLFYNNMYEKTFFSLGDLATRFTRKQLEGLGLGWVFDCPGIEIEEVTE